MAAHVLVIDDDTGILEAIQALLEDEGYEVTSVTNAAIASDLIHGKVPSPDLILLDVLLSGEDGRDVCRALKGHASTKQIPIIMMSAHPNAQATVRSCGADGFLAKPYAIEDLLAQIESHHVNTRSNDVAA